MQATSAWSGHAVVAALAAATFANTLTCGFVWDDRAAILTNRDLRTDETSMWDLWSHDFGAGHSLLTFRANYAVGGYNPMGYHLLNVLLHVAASVLVVAVGRRVVAPFGASHAPVFAGALFAVHPIHCDAVASVVGRADVLCTCLSLLAFCLYDASASATCTHWPLYVASLVCILAATLCKELGAATLGILVTLELLRAAPSKSKRLGPSAGVVRTAVLFGLGSAGIASRIALNGGQTLYAWSILENDVSLLPWGVPRLLTTLHTHGWYLYKLFWPQYLCNDYGFRTIPIIASLFQMENVGTLVAYASLLVLVGVAFDRRRTSPLLLLASFGLFPFVPAANVLFPIGTVVAERLMYFPSVGFCFVLGYALEHALRVSMRWQSLLLALLFLSLLTVGAARSMARNFEWSSETRLFESSVLTAPWSVKGLSNLSKVLLGPDPPRAAAYLERALSVAPRYAAGQLNLGLAYIRMGKPLHAMQNLLHSIDVDASLAAYAYLGRCASSFYLASQLKQFPTSNATHACQLAHQLLDYTIAQGASMPGLFFARGLLAYYTSDFSTAFAVCANQLTTPMNQQQPTTTAYEIQPTPTVKPVAPDGMEADANNLVVGQWKVGICGCFTDVIPNCCMAYWCPCVSLAQIVHRIGTCSYMMGLLVFGLAYLLMYITAAVSGGYHYSAIASGSAGVACGICVMIVRNIVRGKLRIPGNCLIDCLCGFFCNCCAIAQMATQVNAYDKGTCAFGPKDTLPGYMA
ncbi:hypothetical protein SPRG_22219 [Saprolegnia parasitica CBS 223.65]|uniref:DUF1736 domain-containing protein n=1 Tax=Saprolegnia parasitica (strain CBS 223.65) TaxID=695850 RepID=A0A067C7E2_SAPPC|nr:hypothetical protein SPRG_22219 [Saprolegnia parasitica CBS 223.65]KDO26438.1 hypothetical protein SPRG_22219 [Saprolegnia parasitica CBS 223.65]|eukprot:XP_012202932.1 hypothetical protein SPRG_22219 [Saprolegnia parasitica CBS 223.65]